MSAVLTPEQRAEWREDAQYDLRLPHDDESTTEESRRILALLDALDAVEASAADQVTAALDEVERRIERKLGITSRALPIVRDIRRQHADQAEAARRVSEVRQSLTGGEKPCRCGSPEAYSLNPAEVVVHRHDGQPCYIAPIDGGEVRS